MESDQFYVSCWVVFKSGWVEYLSTVQLPELVQFRILNLRQMRGGELLGSFCSGSTLCDVNIATCASVYNNRDAVDSFLLRHSNFVIADTL